MIIMKHANLTAIAILMTVAVFRSNAQTIERQVFSTAGFSAFIDNHFLSGTIGEAVIGKFQSGNRLLTAGFQQMTHQLKTGTVAPALPDLEVQIYPNPAADLLNLKTASTTRVLTIITDTKGKVIHTENWSTETSINCTTWPSGGYFISIRLEDGPQILSTFVLKIK